MSNTSSAVPVTVARGDGIGPEIMDATLRIIEAAGANLAIEEIEIGEKVYERGNTAGIDPSSWESLRRTRVFLKAPITTPQGGGFKSLNVTVRKTLGLYSNIRPTVAYDPFVATKHPGMDVVIVRENEEDLYAGIEYQQSDDVVHALKIHSVPASERICRYAFEYARANGRKKVTAFTKDNILKLTDGMFHRVFDQVAADYPEIENEHWIIDIGAAKLADTPEAFDVIVLENLYGDILSDVAAQIAGSVGLAGSANVGEGFAMFEAIHGSAPRRAGQDVANPSGLFLGAILMLVHIGQGEAAEKAHNAWLKAIEDGVHTYDIYDESVSTQKVGTTAFADAVIERIGQRPQTLKPVSYSASEPMKVPAVGPRAAAAEKKLEGVDVFVSWVGDVPSQLGDRLTPLGGDKFDLTIISNRGQRVWPGDTPETFLTDQWRCRWMGNGDVTNSDIVALLGRITDAGVEFAVTENLVTFNGERGYTLSQGE